MDHRGLLRRVLKFERDARRILARHETSATRVITLEESYQRLGKLTIQQDDLLRQALRGIEHGLYRSAIVMSWAAMMDYVEEKLSEDGFSALNKAYPKWSVRRLDDLRDNQPDFQKVVALRKVGLCSRIEERALRSLLSRRNECAHPSSYYPGLNEALGYTSEVLQRIEILRGRKGEGHNTLKDR